MNHGIMCGRSLARIGASLLLSAGASMTAQSSTAVTVKLAPGNDIQAAVTAAPEGTTFILLPGVYRMQSVAPKNGDIFIGQGSVILNGSQVLSFQSDPAGSGMWVANAVATQDPAGKCEADHPLCGFTQDLFINNQLQTPAATLQAVKQGSWYFDRAHNQVYVPTSPSGQVVELGMKLYAFYGPANNVQISHLTVEKYASQAQRAAIGDRRVGSAWIVDNVEARWNHGSGISLRPGSQLTNSFIHHNGQLGISMGGADCKAIHNEISWNNYAGYRMAWEAGGSKFWGTTNLVVQSNYVHDNKGPGLWTDTDNVGTLYENNTVINNLQEGIKHEVSFSAIIRNNTVKGNGNAATKWVWNSQIEIQNSSGVEVYGNTVEVPPGGGNGISIINQKRGGSALGAWVAANNYVHDNTITYVGPRGLSGVVDDTHSNVPVNNRFDSNHYKLKGGSAASVNWSWYGATDWRGMLAAGQEAHGTCCN